MRKLITALACAAAAASAAAQDGNGYVAAGAGPSKFGIDYCDRAPAGYRCDESGTAWHVRAGYHLTPWLGLEAAWLDFGTARTPGVLAEPPAGTVPIPVDSDRRAYGPVASLAVSLPLGPVRLSGRAGWGAMTGKFKGRAAVQDVTTGAIQYFDAQARATKGRPVFGAGAAYAFGKAWSARLDWDRTKTDDGLNPRFDAEMYTLGLGVRF